MKEDYDPTISWLYLDEPEPVGKVLKMELYERGRAAALPVEGAFMCTAPRVQGLGRV